jgi:hypothetical protein
VPSAIASRQADAAGLLGKTPDFAATANRDVVIEDQDQREVDVPVLVLGVQGKQDFVIAAEACGEKTADSNEHRAARIRHARRRHQFRRDFRICLKAGHHQTRIAIFVGQRRVKRRQRRHRVHLRPAKSPSDFGARLLVSIN